MTTTLESIHDVPSLAGDYWQWRGQKIYYVKAGNSNPDKPPLLLVHGFGASTDHWRKNIHQLQEKYQVWAIDLLGFGRSGKPPWEYNGALWRDQLNDFISEIITQPAVLAGNSLGGYASLCAAAEGAGNVAGLILINSAGPFSDSRPKNPTFTQKLTRFILSQSWVTFFLFQRLRNKKNIRKTLEQVYADHTAINDQLIEDIYRPSCDAGALQVFASVFKNPEGDNIDDLLRQLSCPLLMLWGEKDPWMKTRVRGARFKEFCPDLTESYLDAGHCPHDEIPEKVNQLIDDWLESNIN